MSCTIYRAGIFTIAFFLLILGSGCTKSLNIGKDERSLVDNRDGVAAENGGPRCELTFNGGATGIVEPKALNRGIVKYFGERAAASLKIAEVGFEIGKLRSDVDELTFTIDPIETTVYEIVVSFVNEAGESLTGSCKATLTVSTNNAPACSTPNEPNAGLPPCYGTLNVLAQPMESPDPSPSPSIVETKVFLSRVCTVLPAHGIPSNQRTLTSAINPIVSVEYKEMVDEKNVWKVLEFMDIPDKKLDDQRPKFVFENLLEKVRAVHPDEPEKVVLRFWVCDDAPNGKGVRTHLCSSRLATQPERILSFRQFLTNPERVGYVLQTFTAGKLPKRYTIPTFSKFQNLASNPNPQFCDGYTPLVMNFGNEPLKTSGPENSGVTYDLNNDGNRVRLGWIRDPNAAFLAYDHDGSGNIENGGELFGGGSLHRRPDGTFEKVEGGNFENGFLALAQLDTNLNGYFDPRDVDWPKTRLWFDRLYDGQVTDPSTELRTLESMGVQWIDLRYDEVDFMDTYGNQVLQQSLFSMNSVGRLIVDIYFRGL